MKCKRECGKLCSRSIFVLLYVLLCIILIHFLSCFKWIDNITVFLSYASFFFFDPLALLNLLLCFVHGGVASCCYLIKIVKIYSLLSTFVLFTIFLVFLFTFVHFLWNGCHFRFALFQLIFVCVFYLFNLLADECVCKWGSFAFLMLPY